MSTFKPGDVVVHPEYGRGIVQELFGKDWVEYGAACDHAALTAVAADLRRLVVIDPDNEDDMDRLGDILDNHEWEPKPRLGAFLFGLADALREFANPKPPKPEEPTGLGAVVEDAGGTLWVRSTWPENDDDHLGKPWAQGPVRSNWQIVDAVRVLSEGVQP